MKKSNEIFNKFLLIYIILNLFYILIGSYLVTEKYISIKIFSYGYIPLLTVNLIIILILLLTKKYKKNKIDIFLLLIIIFAIISTIFAYKPMKALYGEWMRYEGFFTICYYITILILTSFLKKEYRKKVVYFILTLGFIECIYAFFQKFNLFNVRTIIHSNNRWVTGFCTNPNFFATLMLICISYSIGLYIESNGKLKTMGLLILIYVFGMGILFSNTLSCTIGLIFVLIVSLIYSIKNKYMKKYLILMLSLILMFILTQKMNLTSIGSDFIKTKSQITELSKGNIDKYYGTGRFEIWSKTMKIVPKYLIHGVGIDNFANVLDGKAMIRKGYIIDKAHNEYLQILVTMGIFSLICYLCLHFIIIKNGIKETFKNHEIYYILPVVGYIIQAQFNISVIEVAPIFYISLGLLIYRDN